MEGEHRTPNVQHRASNASAKYELRNTRSRALGQYFTPEPVVALCYQMLRELDPGTTSPSIIDPACGEGAFLSYALAHGITSADRLLGVEKDPTVARSIPSGSMNLFIGDGLSSPDSWKPIRSHSPILPFSGSFADWVVGNPPFGTGALGSADHERLRANYVIWQEDARKHADLSRYPIEVLFVERFVQLARPGGYIAIIIPDGILANARLAYVREWLWRHTEVKSVVSLPQHTFQRHGACAKASILLLRKRENGREGEGVCRSVETWEYGGSLYQFPHSPILPSSPGARLDPAYYHPRFAENMRILEDLPNVARFGDLIEFTTYGTVGSRQYSETGVRYLTPANLVLTDDGYVSGVDIRSPERFVPEGSRNDPQRSRLRKGDLLLANSGVGCIGRAAVFYSDEPCNISQHINLVRLRDIKPEYVAVYLQTRFARLQIHREKCGVGPCGINFDRIKSILIPVLPGDKRREIVEGYGRQAIPELVERLEESILTGSK